MVSKVFLLAAIALSAANAQTQQQSAGAPKTTSGFQFKETYPESSKVPTPKPEWMELIKNANITNAPVLKNSGDAGPQQQGSGDPYCDWTFTGCTRDDDIVACPKGQWGITYDDGPTEFSAKLYDFLDQTQQKATLFMIGGQVVRFPDLVQRAFKTGHELAMHTWSHSYLTTQTNEQIVAELKWNELAIKEVTGVSPRFFRPPYGDIDDRVRSIAKALGFTPVIWNHDTDDWMVAENPGFKETWIDGNVTEWASEASSATVGGISLEHDLYQKTVDAAIRVLPTLQKAYKVTTVGQCTGQQSYKEGANPNAANTTTSAAPSSASAAATGASAKGQSTPNATQSSQQTQGTQEHNAAGSLASSTAATLVLALISIFMMA